MKKPTTTQKGGSRYRALIIFITVFVLSIISVLGLNFYISAQFEADALAINLAGRQRMLSQRTMKSLLNIAKAQQNGSDVSPALAELGNTFRLFDTTLTAFDQGGWTTGAGGNEVELAAVAINDGREAVNSALAIWTDYRATVAALLDSDPEILQAMADATRFALQNNLPLLESMNELTSYLEDRRASGVEINLAGRQRMLSQRITKALFEVQLAQLNNTDVSLPLAELERARELFNRTLNAFDEGGTTINTDSLPVTLSALSEPSARQIIDQAKDLWQPLDSRLRTLIQGDQTPLQQLTAAIAIATDNNLNLLTLMNDLTVALERDSSQRSSLLRLIQIIGISLALFMFAIILFYFLRQLRNSDRELTAAKAETDRILETVKDGLFLMDKDYSIGSQHSHSLRTILDQQKLAGESFLSILRKIVPEKTLKTAEDYLDLLFGDRVNEELVTDLNPLDEVEVYFDSGSGEHQVKHLEFSFKRAKVGDQISHLLVQVDDISQRVKLERELKESQEKAQQQFDLMLNVLHVEPGMLGEFLNQTEESLDQINAILRERSMGPQQNRVKLDRIFRMMHSIKGDAAALDLGAFEDKAHDFENTLQSMRDKKDLQGSDFLPLAIKLDDFMNQIDSLRSLIQRLSDLQAAVRQEPVPTAEPTMANMASDESTAETMDDKPPTTAGPGLGQRLTQLSQRLAQESDKQIRFELSGEEYLPETYQRSISEVLTQLLRNSIVHGIETPATRQAHDKPEQGLIQVSIKPSESGGLEVIFHDDGQGLSTEKIKQTAIDKGIISAEKAASIDRRKIIGLIFQPGFSTADKVDKHAGRGVGMDVVASTIRELGGSLKIRSVDHQFCEFRLTLPQTQTADLIAMEDTDAAHDR